MPVSERGILIKNFVQAYCRFRYCQFQGGRNQSEQDCKDQNFVLAIESIISAQPRCRLTGRNQPTQEGCVFGRTLMRNLIIENTFTMALIRSWWDPVSTLPGPRKWKSLPISLKLPNKYVRQSPVIMRHLWTLFTFLNSVRSPSSKLLHPSETSSVSGFLICIPMLDEWQTEVGIKVIDGWSFQVCLPAFVEFVRNVDCLTKFSSECAFPIQ